MSFAHASMLEGTLLEVTRSRARCAFGLDDDISSFVISVEEMLECISVTLNPMRLNGHLHMFSVVCSGVFDSVYNPCGLSLNLWLLPDELYKGEDSFEYHNYAMASLMQSLAAVL
eukprot:scaffold2257_cov23-Cyclotella_meneghiniana.AAC.1